MVLEVDEIRTEENDCSQAGAGNGITLRDRLHGIADRIQFVGDGSDRLGQTTHHRDAAGIVCDRAEGIERDNDA